MKSTLCRTYFKCIRRDLDSTFALGLSCLTTIVFGFFLYIAVTLFSFYSVKTFPVIFALVLVWSDSFGIITKMENEKYFD